MKVLFAAPRFHTNQAELLRYLVEHGCNVDFLVTRFGKTEDHTFVLPRRIGYSPFSLKLLSVIFGKVSDDDLYRRALPSPGEVARIVRKHYGVAVVRYPFSVMGMAICVCAKLGGARVVFYTQADLHRPRRWPKDVVAAWVMWIFGARWMTPCLGAKDYPVAVRGMEYVPFVMRTKCTAKRWFQGDRVNIISVGKFVPRKNHELLLEAVRAIEESFAMSLTIIGEVGTEEGENVLRRIEILRSQMNTPVRILKELRREAVFAEYCAADLFVLASRDEPASVSNLEAMACGLPVVTSSSNKTSCYTDGNGRVFLSDSKESLVSVLRELIGDRALLVEMGRRSLELVAERHNPSSFYENMILSDVSRAQ